MNRHIITFTKAEKLTEDFPFFHFSAPRTEIQRRKEAALKKVLKETSVGYGMWLGADQEIGRAHV